MLMRRRENLLGRIGSLRNDGGEGCSSRLDLNVRCRRILLRMRANFLRRLIR